MKIIDNLKAVALLFPKTIVAAILMTAAMVATPDVFARVPLYTYQVQNQKSFVSNGVEYTMYWVDLSIRSAKERTPQQNYVKYIYIVPNAYTQSDGSIKGRPFSIGNLCLQEYSYPTLTKIVFHDIDEPFVGAIVKADLRDKNNFHIGGYYTWEIKVPEEIAHSMMDLVKGRTEWRIVVGGNLDRIFGGANMELKKDASLQGLKWWK